MYSDVSLRRERHLRFALTVNAGVVAMQVVAGLAASSLGLLADAGHNLTDVAAIVVSLLAVRMARRPPDAARSFGYHRGTILAAQLNAASILVVSAVVLVESLRRLGSPAEVDGLPVVVAALVGALANLFSALRLSDGLHDHRGQRHASSAAPGDRELQADRHGDLNIRATVLHLVGDGLASVAVAATGAVILVTGGWDWLDPLASLGIAVLIGSQGWRLLRATTEVLLEATPSGLDTERLGEEMAGVEGVETVHDLHVWTLSSEVRALSAHLVLDGHPTLEQAQVVAARVKAALDPHHRIAHATLELECEACGEPDAHCAMDVPEPRRPVT